MVREVARRPSQRARVGRCGNAVGLESGCVGEGETVRIAGGSGPVVRTEGRMVEVTQLR